MRRIFLIAAAAAAFHATPPAQHSSHLIRAAKGDLDDDLSPEDMAKFAAQAPSDQEQAALFQQLKEQFAAIEGSTYGGARDEDYFEEEEENTLESELRKRRAVVEARSSGTSTARPSRRRSSGPRRISRSTVEKMKEDDLAVTNIKRAELEEEMAAEARAFETRMDALAREAGVDPRGPLPEFDEDVIVTLDDVLAEPAPVSNIPVSNAVRVCGAKGGALQELVVDELKKLGVEEVSVGDAKRGNTGTLGQWTRARPRRSASWRRRGPDAWSSRRARASRGPASSRFCSARARSTARGAWRVLRSSRCRRLVREVKVLWSAWARPRARLAKPSWRSATRSTRPRPRTSRRRRWRGAASTRAWRTRLSRSVVQTRQWTGATCS